MQNLTEIVNFYKSLKNKGDLFNESPFSDNELLEIEKHIEHQNQNFFNLIFQLAHRNNFNYKSVQIVINQLSEI